MDFICVILLYFVLNRQMKELYILGGKLPKAWNTVILEMNSVWGQNRYGLLSLTIRFAQAPTSSTLKVERCIRSGPVKAGLRMIA